MIDGVTLYFIRHGETDWNSERRYQGQADIALNDTGRTQAKRNGQALRQFLPGIETAGYVASPLSRAKETMRIVRHSLELPADDFCIDHRITELNYGNWQGHLADDLAKMDPDGVAARNHDPFHWRPGNGETYAELTERIADWLAGVRHDTVVASHGGVSRALRGLVLGLDPSSVPWLPVPHDRVLLLRKNSFEWL